MKRANRSGFDVVMSVPWVAGPRAAIIPGAGVLRHPRGRGALGALEPGPRSERRGAPLRLYDHR